MHGQHPDDYRRPMGHGHDSIETRLRALEREVKSLRAMLKRRDAKIARLERSMNSN